MQIIFSLLTIRWIATSQNKRREDERRRREGNQIFVSCTDSRQSVHLTFHRDEDWLQECFLSLLLLMYLMSERGERE